MDRRHFLQSSIQIFLSSVALSACSTHVPSSRKSGKGNILIGIHKSSHSSTVRILNLDTRSHQDFEVPIPLPHSIMFNPANNRELYIFEFLGGAVILNLESGKFRSIENDKGFLFGGHAVLSPESGTAWCSEMHPDKATVIRARSLSDLSLVSGSGASIEGGHHVVKLPNTNTIVTGGFSPNSSERFLTFFDTKERRVIQHTKIDHFAGHLLPISSDEVVGVANAFTMPKGTAKSLFTMVRNNQHPATVRKELNLNEPAPLFYANTKGDYRAFWDESKTKNFQFGFGLDLISSKDGTYLSGHLGSSTIIAWRRFEIIKIISVPSPTGILATTDGTQFLVLSEGALKIYSTSSFEQEDEIRYDKNISLLSRYV